MKKKKFRRFQSDYKPKGEYILRDFLAMERTTMANERTFFAYVRISFYLVIVGIALVELENFEAVQWLGFALFGISVFLIIFGIVRYQMMQKKLNRYYEGMEVEQDKLKKDK